LIENKLKKLKLNFLTCFKHCKSCIFLLAALRLPGQDSHYQRFRYCNFGNKKIVQARENNNSSESKTSYHAQVESISRFKQTN